MLRLLITTLVPDLRWTTVQVNKNFHTGLHEHPKNAGPGVITSFGAYSGGDFSYGNKTFNLRSNSFSLMADTAMALANSLASGIPSCFIPMQAASGFWAQRGAPVWQPTLQSALRPWPALYSRPLTTSAWALWCPRTDGVLLVYLKSPQGRKRACELCHVYTRTRFSPSRLTAIVTIIIIPHQNRNNKFHGESEAHTRRWFGQGPLQRRQRQRPRLLLLHCAQNTGPCSKRFLNIAPLLPSAPPRS
jgi:hypothetical protein